jgi:hypothetical protein
MTPRSLMLAIVAALACAPALAQPAKEGERPLRPDSASNAAVGGWCDALTGEKKEQCLRDERRRQERAAKDEPRAPAGSCDALIGPEKDRCLRKGGTVEVGAGSSRGASAREH